MQTDPERWKDTACRTAYYQGYLHAIDDMLLLIEHRHLNADKAHDYLWGHRDNKLYRWVMRATLPEPLPESPPRVELPERQPAKPLDRKAIWDEHKGVCGICGLAVSFAECEIDHIIPKSKGGGNQLANLQPAHRKCNRSKGDKL